MADQDTFATRRGRQVPPPIHPKATAPPAQPEIAASAALTTAPIADSEEMTQLTSARNASTRSADLPSSHREDHFLTVSPTEALANLQVRVRRPLDDQLADLVYYLRRHHDIRSSKAELIEMLLWEVPAASAEGVVARLAAFRRKAPRR